MATCTPVDLGAGTTPTHPCTTLGVEPFAVEWCTGWDFLRVRRAVQTERNALVLRLMALDDLILAGKAKGGSPAVKNAVMLQAEALATLRRMPENYFALAVDLTVTPTQGAVLLGQLAERLHAAICDVDQELEAAGAKPPATPIPPKEPGGIKDELLKWGSAGLQLTGQLVVGAVLLAGGVYAVARILRRTQETGPSFGWRSR